MVRELDSLVFNIRKNFSSAGIQNDAFMLIETLISGSPIPIYRGMWRQFDTMMSEDPMIPSQVRMAYRKIPLRIRKATFARAISQKNVGSRRRSRL